MYNIFIGWSGNKPLADKLGDLIAQSGRMRPIVGGGVPSDMFVGAQAIDQINRCKKAILRQTVLAYYPRNVFLSTKFEHECILALSEYCNYMPNSFRKTLYKKTILSKMKEWEKELVYAFSLTDKIKGNIKNFGD